MLLATLGAEGGCSFLGGTYSPPVDTLLSSLALARIMVLIFYGTFLVLPELRDVAFEEAAVFREEIAELEEESAGCGVVGRDCIGKQSQEEANDSFK